MPTVTRSRRRRPHAVAFPPEHLIGSRMPEHQVTPPQPALNDLDIGQATDVGRVREANEDALLVLRADGRRTGQALVAVADGMGGHKAGEVASALAIASLGSALEQTDPT